MDCRDLELFGWNDLWVLLIALVFVLLFTSPLLYYTWLRAIENPGIMLMSLPAWFILAYFVFRFAWNEEVKIRRIYRDIEERRASK
jgi:hypothetical protein